jgi:membrane-associated phospholipid phosphatase
VVFATTLLALGGASVPWLAARGGGEPARSGAAIDRDAISLASFPALPSAPLCAIVLLCLLSLYCLAKGLRGDAATPRAQRAVLLAGVPLGLALLGTPYALLLVPAAFVPIGRDRARSAWFRRPELWISLGMACVLSLPRLFASYDQDASAVGLRQRLVPDDPRDLGARFLCALTGDDTAVHGACCDRAANIRIVDVSRGHRADGAAVDRDAGTDHPGSRAAPADPHSRLEYRLFFAVNHGLQSPLADWLIGCANWLGVGYIAGPLALLGLAWFWRRQPRGRWRRDLAAVAVACTLCAVLVTSIKAICDRDRPVRLFRDAVARGAVELHVMFAEKSHHGFPSGHTATAFLIATLLMLVVGRRAIGWTGHALAVIVGISTMYVGAHLPLDVLAGALVGTIAALWGWRMTLLAMRPQPPPAWAR